MAIAVALLRGVNVGGKRVAMPALKAALEADGFASVKTWLQSGNAVLDAGQRSIEEVAEAVRRAVRTSAGVDCAVLLRAGSELQAALTADPFPDCHGSMSIYTFLDGPPAASGVDALRAKLKGEEALEAGDGVIYAAFPDGISASDLFKVDWRKALATEITARNRNTVQKLVALAREMEGETAA